MTVAGGERAPHVLLSYFFGDDTIPLGGSCERALRELGCRVDTFDCRIEHPLQRPLLRPAGRLLRGLGLRRADPARWLGLDNEVVRERALAAAVERTRPDVLLAMRGNRYRRDFLARLKARYGLTTVCWWLYGPEEHTELVAEAGDYDRFFAIYRAQVPGRQIDFLPALALDRSLYHPVGPGLPFVADIAFVGRHSPRRDAVLSGLTDLPLSIWGPGWRRPRDGWRPRLWRRVVASGIWGDALLQVYARSRIVLNVSVWNPGQESGLNLRIFDVPACGGFLLTDHSDEIAEFFTPGKHIETWRDPDELRDKLHFYLANEAARNRIAAAGLARSDTLPTYVDRMRDLLGQLVRPFPPPAGRSPMGAPRS